MQDNPIISVVVPIYNVEKYLNQCIESIINQSFTDFELILVDDGSPDNCPQICDEWAKKDSRVKVIHKDNEGVAKARLDGVRIAVGGYVTFVDSDDWVENDFLKIQYDNIVNKNFDIVQCNYREVHPDKNISCTFKEKIYTEDNIDNLVKEFVSEQMVSINPSMWNKIFKRDIIEQAVIIGESNLSIGEDYLVVFAAVCISNRVFIADTPELYNYRNNIISVTKNYNSKLKYETEVFFQHISKIADKFNIAAMDYSLKIISVNMLYIYKCAISDMSFEDKIDEIKEISKIIDCSKWRIALKEEQSKIKRLVMRLYMSFVFKGYIKTTIKFIEIIYKLKKIYS